MRTFNFSPGPAVLPEEVLRQAQEEMLDWHGSGMSVMEMSHRGKEFMSIAAAAEADLRELLAIPSDYKVLFLQGGATSQFAMVPMNLLRGKTERRLHPHRRMGEEGDRRGEEVLQREHRRQQRGPQVHLCAGAVELEAVAGSRVRALHRQRDHRWRRISLDPGHRLGSAGV